MLLVLLLAGFPVLDSYAGSYRAIPQECDQIRPVVERVVSRMNFLIRPIARSRLMKTQIVFPVITVTSTRSEFRIRHENGTDVPHSDVRSGVKAKAPDGTDITVRLTPGPPLTETYESADGKRENTYVLSPDGSKLTVQVRVTSPRLPDEIRYRIVYQRESGAPHANVIP
jgi:hypothetical protein